MATVETPHDISLTSSLPVSQDSADLDFMAFTMAALRLVNPWATEAKPKWTQRIEPGTPEAKDRIISLAEVSHHDTPQDCWVVIFDRVYDIQGLKAVKHPGGVDIMLEYAGQDASTAYRSSGHSKMAAKALERFLVGELPMHERMYRRPGGMRLSDIPD